VTCGAIVDGLLALTAGQVMTHGPRTIGPEALAEKAVAMMSDKNITCLFVTPEGSSEPIGIIKIQDCLRAGIV